MLTASISLIHAAFHNTYLRMVKNTENGPVSMIESRIISKS